MKKFLLFTLALLLVTLSSWAATLTVGPSGPPTYQYATITEAITAASPGDIINVAAGTYEELIVIDKPITLNGPNATIAGNGSRVPEAVIQFPAGAADESGLIYVGTNLSGVTIAGFDLKCQDATITSGLFGYYLILTEKVNNLTIRNNRMYSSVIPMYILTDNSMTDYRTGLLVEGNYVDCGPNVNNSYNRGIYVQATSGTIQDNQFLNTSIGIQYMPYGHTTSALIQRNTITAVSRGLYHNYQTKGAAQVTWSQNEVSVAPNDRAGLKAQVYGAWTQQLTFRGMDATTFGTQGSGAAPQVYFNNNKVDGNIASSPYYTSTIGYRTTDASATGVATLTGNSFTNLNMGVVNNSSVSVTATCNWWGTTVPAEIAAKITGSATYIPYSVSDGGACAGGMPVVVTRAGTIISGHATIQAGIDAAAAGDVINVYPGNYSETATNCYTVSTQGTAGPYQFGLYFPPTKPGISIIGVDASGNPITNYANVAANITTNATNPFGESGMFVNADNITIQGLKILDNVAGNGNNKTVEIIGNNFTMKYCHVDINDGGSIYFNDWSFAGGVSTQTKYNLTGNNFAKGCSVDICSGTGYTGAVSDRVIANNVFTGAGCSWDLTWGAISFNGIVPAVGWYTAPVGAATISGNTFSDYSEFIIRTRGTVAADQFNWQGYFTNNTFNKAVITLSDEPSFTPRSYTYSNSGGTTFPDVRRIGGAIQQDILNVAQAGDVITVAAGTYAENVDITKSVELRGANYGTSGCTPRVVESVIQGTFTIGTDNITVDGFEFTGANAQIASTSGATVRSNITIKNNYLHTTTAQIPIRHGLGMGGGIGSTNWIVSNNKIEDIQCASATAIAVFNVTNATINNNCITHTNAAYAGRRGINADGLQTATINGNIINLGGDPTTNVDGAWLIQISMSDQDAQSITIDGNTISNAYSGVTTLSQRNVTGLTVTNNAIGPVSVGVTLNGGSAVPAIAQPLQSNINIANNSITTVTPTISGAIGAAVRLRNLHETHANGPVGFSNVTVNNNGFSVPATDAAVINYYATYSLDATCNWFGTTVASGVAAKVSGDVQFLPFSTSASPINCSGVGPVVNTTKSLSYMTIQAAINAADAGNVITVAAGTYVENVEINKSVGLRGANYNTSGCTTRVAESVIQGTFTIGTDNITVDGFKFTGVNAQIASTSGATVRSNITIKNNYLHATTAQIPIRHGLGMGGGIGSTNWIVSNNKIEDIQSASATAIAVFNVTNATINNNCITHTNAAYAGRRGINADGLQTATINGNTIDLGGDPTTNVPAAWLIQVSMSDRDAQGITISGNTISNAYYGITTLSQRNVTNLTVTNNVIGPVSSGVTINTGGVTPVISQPTQSNISILNNAVTTVTPTISGAIGAAVKLRNLHEANANGPITFNNVTVNSNSFAVPSADKAVINDVAAYQLDATCNWYGTTDASTITAKISGPVSYIPYSVSAGGACTGYPPVLVKRAGTTISGYSSIQAAVSATTTLAGDVIEVAAGTYVENVIVNKQVTINGAGNTTIVQGVSGDAITYTAAGSGTSASNRAYLKNLKIIGSGKGLYASEVVNYLTIDGVTFYGTTGYSVHINNVTGVMNDWVINNCSFNANSLDGIRLGMAANINKVAVTNCSFTNNTGCGMYVPQQSSSSGAFNDVQITNCTFTGNGGTSNLSAMYIEKISNATISGNIFTNNGISTNARAIILNAKYGSYSNVTITDNIFTETRASATNGYAMFLAGRNDSPYYNSNPATLSGLTVTYNSVEGFRTGISLENNVTWASATIAHNKVQDCYTLFNASGANSGSTLTISANSLVGCTYSIVNQSVGTSITASCNWFGTANGNTIASKLYGTVSYSPWLVDGTNEATGTGFYQSTPNCTGTPVVIASATPDHITCGETTGSVAFVFSGGTANYSITWSGGSATGITASPYTVSNLAAGAYTFTITDVNGSTATATATILAQPVVNSTTNTYYTTIQSAIDAASAGNVISVCAGTYTENVTLNKSLDVRGPNYGINPNTGTRGAEAILNGTFTLQSNDIIIDGFAMTGAGMAVYSPGTGQSGITIRNNHMYAKNGGRMIEYWGPAQATTNWTVSNNKIEDIQATDATAITLFNITGVTVNNNVILHTNSSYNGRRGMNLDGCQNVTVSGNTINMGLVNPTSNNANNEFTKARYQVQLSATNQSVSSVTVSGNTLGGAYDGIITLGNGVFDGINITGNDLSNNVLGIRFQAGTNTAVGSQSNIAITNNSISSSNRCVYLQNGEASNDPYSSVSITNNSLMRSSPGFALEVQTGANLTNSPGLATNNYWGTCPSVSGIATYFPYWSTISGTPGSFTFGGEISNITASASNATICLGQSVTLSAANGSNFEWFSPAGTSLGLGVNKVVTPAAPGSLTYTVTGKDLNGCTGGTASATFTVNPALVAGISQTGTGPYTLTATAGSSYTYAWSNGATTQSITVNPAVTSTFSVIITSGPCTASASKTIDVVYVSAGANQSICPGGSAQLNATISGVTPTLYAWSPATGLSNTAIANPVATPASTTTYTVTINATYTAAVTITVRPKPTANAGDDKTIFVGQSTVLTGVGSLGTPSYNYIWTPGSLTTASITVSPAATQTYNLVVTDAFGCESDADQATVTVNAMPASGNTVTGTISYAFGTVNAQMHDVAITLTPVLGGASYTGTSAASGNGTYSIPGVPDATYYVYLHSPKPWGGVTSADITAIANHYRASRPCLLTGIKRLAGDVYGNSTSASVNVDDKNEVQDRINNIAYTFPGDWVFTKTSDISVNPFPAQFANDGYSGGSAFSSIQIIVAAATPASLVNNFSALCYGDVNASYNGVKTTEINNPTVYDGTTEDWFELSNYPNPFVGQTNFTYNQAIEGEATIQVFNLMGGLMGKIVNPDRSEGSHKIAFDGSRLAPGIYIYVFTLRTSDDVMTQNGKMVIVK